MRERDVLQAASIGKITSPLSAPMKLHTFAAPDAGIAGPFAPVPFGGKMYFAASDGTTSQLWVTDGTAAGTVQVTTDPGRSNVQFVTPMDGKLYFSAYTDTTGQELYASDGTESGTALVADIAPGNRSGTSTPWSSAPTNLLAVGSTLFFSAGPAGPGGAYAYTASGGVVRLASDFYTGGYQDFDFPLRAIQERRAAPGDDFQHLQ